MNRHHERELLYEITKIIASASAEFALQEDGKRDAPDQFWWEARQVLMWETVITGLNEMLNKYDLSKINGRGNLE